MISAIGQDQNLLGIDNTLYGAISLTKGNGIDAEPAEIAGTVAAKRVFPLERNGYKVQILKGLIRKALLAQ